MYAKSLFQSSNSLLSNAKRISLVINMKKICFFIGNINNVGGTERVTSVIANELQLRGYQTYILSLQCGDKPFFELEKSIHVSQIFNSQGRGLTRYPNAIVKLRKYLKEHNIDILVDVDSMLALYSIPAMVGLSARHICWEHFNYKVDLGKWPRRLARKLAARFADDVITLTERDKNLWNCNTVCRAKITAIPNPVTIEIPIISNFNKEKIFLAVGRLAYQKGFDLLLQAWREVSLSHPEWQLRIVGDGEDRDSLERKCHYLGIESNTAILPKTNEIEKYYKQAAFFVMSSRFEGLPLVLIEAQAYGLPIISFDCDTGPAEVVKHEHTGWLCESGNISALRDEMLKAIKISTCDSEYINYSKQAIQNVERFKPKPIVDTWVRLIQTS